MHSESWGEARMEAEKNIELNKNNIKKGKKEKAFT